MQYTSEQLRQLLELRNPETSAERRSELKSLGLGALMEDTNHLTIKDLQRLLADKTNAEEVWEPFEEECKEEKADTTRYPKMYMLLANMQNGKTQAEILDILYRKEFVHIHLCRNILDDKKQYTSRLQKALVEEGLHNICASLSSDPGDCKSMEVLHFKIHYEGVKFITTLSNPTRIQHITQLLGTLTHHAMVRIFVDEAHKPNKPLVEAVKKWHGFACVKEIVLVTATAKEVYAYYSPDIKMFKPQNAIMNESYVGYTNMGKNVFIDVDISNCENKAFEYIKKVYELHDFSPKNNPFIFAPAEVAQKTHVLTAEFFKARGYNVLSLNSKRTLYVHTHCTTIHLKDLELLDDMQLSEVIPYLVETYELSNLVITGNMCLSEGVTIMSPNFMITDAIIHPFVSNESKQIQLAGRICGNMLHWDNYKGVRLNMTKDTFDLVRTNDYNNAVLNTKVIGSIDDMIVFKSEPAKPVSNKRKRDVNSKPRAPADPRKAIPEMLSSLTKKEKFNHKLVVEIKNNIDAKYTDDELLEVLGPRGCGYALPKYFKHNVTKSGLTKPGVVFEKNEQGLWIVIPELRDLFQ